MNATTSATPEVPEVPATPVVSTPPETATTEQRLRAIDTLLADPEAIPDPLEVELYAYREQITGETVG
jgi:hypothetical protein